MTRKMIWTGRYLSGSSSYQGRIEVASSMTVSNSQRNDKHFEYVTIKSQF